MGPYKILSRESDMNYKICGKLRDSGKEDIRVVHVDHLIPFETTRSVLFPNYTPDSFEDEKHPAITPACKNKQYVSVGPDLFASECSESEKELVSNITWPSSRNRTSDPDRNKAQGTTKVSGEPAPRIKARKSSVASRLMRSFNSTASESEPERRYPTRTRKQPNRLGVA